MTSQFRVYRSSKNIPIDVLQVAGCLVDESSVQNDLEQQIEDGIKKVKLDHRFWQKFSSSADERTYGGFDPAYITQKTVRFAFDGRTDNPTNHVVVRYVCQGELDHLVLATIEIPTIDARKTRQILNNILNVYDKFFSEANITAGI